jgi:quercetin dioxygenase-like cupin family protein
MNASSLGAILLLLAGPASTRAPEESVAPLLSQALPGVTGKTFSVAEVRFRPGARAVAHRHGSAFVYAYVLEGIVTSQLEGEASKRYGVGEGWTEQPGAHHLVTANASSTMPARLLVTFVSDDGEPLKTADPPR